MAPLKYRLAAPLICIPLQSPVAMATTFFRSTHLRLLVTVAFFLCVLVSSAAGYGGSEAGGKASRRLLQVIQPCPVDFAVQNYTIVTSVCNATNPNKQVCCDAFTTFACPFAVYINDMTTNCATTMFSYLNLAGGYPAQFFQMCQGDEQGLLCPEGPAPSPSPSSITMEAGG